MPGTNIQKTLSSETDTKTFATVFAGLLRPGDIVLLNGSIGAGKTFFARHVILDLLAEPEDVPSPTFTLVQTYETRIGTVLHCDLYRITGPDDAAELGLFDEMGESTCLIEWPDRLGPDTPSEALQLMFSQGVNETERQIAMSSTSTSWGRRLEEFRHG